MFVCLLDLQFRSRFLCAFYMFGSVRFRFGKQNFDWLVLFGSGRTVKHCFGRSLISRINWCKGHWCGSTYMVVRLSDVSSKTGYKCILCILACFRAYVGQPESHIGWATSMPFTLIHPTYPRTNLWNFWEKYWELGELKNSFFWVGHFYFFCFIPMKISQFLG